MSNDALNGSLQKKTKTKKCLICSDAEKRLAKRKFKQNGAKNESENMLFARMSVNGAHTNTLKDTYPLTHTHTHIPTLLFTSPADKHSK